MQLAQNFQWLTEHDPADHDLLMQAVPDDFPRLPTGAGIGLAVSGGGDSMAMLHLVAAAARHAGLTVEAATIDHRLRPEAASEARFVAEIAGGLGIAHQTLVWDDHPATGNLMAAGSAARRDLLAGWAAGRGIGHVYLAHTADDQAETFLMGLSRASGLDGLTGMRPRFDHNGVSFWRPLLRRSRAELRDFLTRNRQSWCEDPSNGDDRYTRVRIRKALPGLAPLGIGLRELNETIGNLARVQELLRHSLAGAFARFGREAAGGLHFGRAEFAESPPELQRRLLVAAIRWISALRHPPRAEALARALAGIGQRRPTTLGGCLIRVTSHHIHLSREPRMAAPPLPFRNGEVWDHRWHLTGPEKPGLQIRALGTEGLGQLPDWRKSGLRRDMLLVSPALWQDEQLVSAPILPQFAAKWQARLHPSFGSFILSH